MSQRQHRKVTSASPAFNISVCIYFNFERNYATTFIHQDNTKKLTVPELVEVLNSLRINALTPPNCPYVQPHTTWTNLNLTVIKKKPTNKQQKKKDNKKPRTKTNKKTQTHNTKKPPQHTTQKPTKLKGACLTSR